MFFNVYSSYIYIKYIKDIEFQEVIILLQYLTDFFTVFSVFNLSFLKTNAIIQLRSIVADFVYLKKEKKVVEVMDCRQLTFTLNNVNYGFPIHTVNEVISLMEITEVPKTPNYIKGVINLRGKIIPVMDLRLKFEMTEVEYNERTSIIIVSVNIKGQEKNIGVVVDTISEVLDLNPEEIEPPPEYGADERISCLNGVGKFKEKVVMLLNIDQVVGGEGIESFFKEDLKKDLAKT